MQDLQPQHPSKTEILLPSAASTSGFVQIRALPLAASSLTVASKRQIQFGEATLCSEQMLAGPPSGIQMGGAPLQNRAVQMGD